MAFSRLQWTWPQSATLLLLICYACFLLGEILKDKKKVQFRFYGTHGQVDPWMPPAGLDIDILVSLKTYLTQKLKQIIESKQKASYIKHHVYQNSLASSAEDEISDSPPTPLWLKTYLPSED